MKKLLSIILTVCMLLSLVIVPVAVNAEETVDTYYDSTIGSYYKFTFGEDGDQYDYVTSSNKAADKTGAITYKGDDFFPLWADSASAGAVTSEYKTVTFADGVEQDVLEIKASANAFLTPLTKEGKPFELKPGVQYQVTIRGYNPVCNAWGQSAVYAGGASNKSKEKVNGLSAGKTEVENSMNQALRWTGGGAVGGSQYALYMKEGTYYSDSSKTVSVPAINSLFAKEEYTGPASKSLSGSWWKQETITIAEKYSAGYNAEKNSYSTKFTTVAGAATETTDDDYAYGNNYLTISVGGGNALSYKDSTGSVPVYSNASKEEIEAAGSLPSVWQITSIEVCEVGYAFATLHVGDEETLIKQEKNTKVPFYTPEAPEGMYFAGWYSDAAFTSPVGAAVTMANNYNGDYYARFEKYGLAVEEDFSGKYYNATSYYAKNASYEGFYFPRIGYSNKTSYSNTVDSGKTPAWKSGEITAALKRAYGDDYDTTYPAGVASFYSDRTWGMPGVIVLTNADGSMFVPEPGRKYFITVRYRLLLNGNGKGMTMKSGYGLNMSYANKTSTTDSKSVFKIAAAFTATEATTEWAETTLDITIPSNLSTDYVPALFVDIDGSAKVAVDTDGDGVTDTYDYNIMQFDSIKVESNKKITTYWAGDDVPGIMYVNSDEKVVIPNSSKDAWFQYDYYWSMDPDKYVEVPEYIDEDITVYQTKTTTQSFENWYVYGGTDGGYPALYNGALPYDADMNSRVMQGPAYTGKYSMHLNDSYPLQYVITRPKDSSTGNDLWATNTNFEKYYMYNPEDGTWKTLKALGYTEMPEFVAATTANQYNTAVFATWRGESDEQGMLPIKRFSTTELVDGKLTFSYKVTFKYMATEKNKWESTFNPRVFARSNLWWGTTRVNGTFTFPAGATDGWVEASMLVSGTNVYGGSVANQEQILDLNWNAQISKGFGMCDIYIDDIVIEEFTNVPTLYLHEGDTVTEITDGVDFGSNYALAVSENIPEGKYFAGWVDANGNAISEVTMPGADVICEAHAYAVFKDYVTDGYSVDYAGVNTKPALKGFAYMQDSAYKTSVTESSWGASYWDANYDGAIIGRNPHGSAYGWDPDNKDASGAQYHPTTHKGYATSTTAGEVGQVYDIGWYNASNFVLRDRDGNAIVPKANTQYAVTINYEVINAGNITFNLLGDRKLAMTGTGANANGSIEYGSSVSTNSLTIKDAKDGEKGSFTFFITTKDFSDAVPMFSVHSSNYSLRAERVATAPNGNGEELGSYVDPDNGNTYYPYKVVGVPQIAIQSFTLVEIDEGNVAVQLKSYEKGVGFTSVVSEGVPGAAINVDTKNFDNKWYTAETAQGNQIVSIYPAQNTVYYDAGYAQAYARVGDSVRYIFGDGCVNGSKEKSFTFENAAIDGDYALHVAATQKINYVDAESFILAGRVTDKHTYKITYKYKAVSANSSFGFSFGMHQDNNFWSRAENFNTTEYRVKNVKVGEWVEETVYFTVDFVGTVTDEAETGLNYNISNDYRATLSGAFLQDATEAGNDLYFKDFVVEDLGEVMTAGGASVLTDAAADAANSQAIRYYFNYTTVDGSTIKLGDDTLTVVERGFLYRNGYLEKGAAEKGFYTTTAGVVKEGKTENFGTCWHFDEATGKMTFSTYVTGFKKTGDTRKLEVKAYVIVEDANGNQFTLYADSINRSVAGVQGVGGATDGDVEDGQ